MAPGAVLVTGLRLPLVLNDEGDIWLPECKMHVSPALIYYTVPVARAVLQSAGTMWENSQYQELANSEGWDIFNLVGNSTFLDAGIERLDELAIFEDDDAAVAHVQACASAGSQGHSNAIVIEHACNSLRYWAWGATWVTSRTGPTT